VIVHHNGGWSANGSSAILDTLEDAKAAGIPLVFMGDDISKHASSNDSTYGRTTIYDLAAIASYGSNGSSGHDVAVVDSNHAMMDGAYGVVGGFWYTNDLDELTLSGVGEEVWMQSSTTGTSAAWTWDDGGHRTAVMQVSVYESHACPISDSAGLSDLEALFKNGLDWALGNAD